MKLKFVCALLLSTASTLDIPLVNQGDVDPEDEALSTLISSALSGAKPGIIKEPTQKNTDKEMDKQITKGLTRNYRFHW